jgi:hypothetical protein
MHTVSSTPKYTFPFIDLLAAALHHGIVQTRSEKNRGKAVRCGSTPFTHLARRFGPFYLLNLLIQGSEPMKSLHLTNTLSRNKERFRSNAEGLVKGFRKAFRTESLHRGGLGTRERFGEINMDTAESKAARAKLCAEGFRDIPCGQRTGRTQHLEMPRFGAGEAHRHD